MSRQKAQQFLCDALGIDFPYVSMGKIDSLDLFGPTELMILQLYRDNQDRWKSVIDIGANLGLHSILMAKLGWTVRAFEPYPPHYEALVANLAANHCTTVQPFKAAVHTYTGQANFVVVHNNTTGNHIQGFKDSYGPRDTISVPVIDCRTLWDCDFVKIDCEGNEAELAKTMKANGPDAIMEVRNEKNAVEVFEHFQAIGVGIWSQKTDWNRVTSVAEMPHQNREGSIFIGKSAPW